MRKQHLPRVERKQLQGEKHEGVSKAEEKQKDLPLIGRLKKETLCVCGGGGGPCAPSSEFIFLLSQRGQKTVLGCVFLQLNSP